MHNIINFVRENYKKAKTSISKESEYEQCLTISLCSDNQDDLNMSREIVIIVKKNYEYKNNNLYGIDIVLKMSSEDHDNTYFSCFRKTIKSVCVKEDKAISLIGHHLDSFIEDNKKNIENSNAEIKNSKEKSQISDSNKTKDDIKPCQTNSNDIGSEHNEIHCSLSNEENTRCKSEYHAFVKLKDNDDRLMPVTAHDSYAENGYFDGDTGMDLFCAEQEVIIPPLSTVAINTGVSIRMPPGYCSYVMPRSSMSKNGILTHFGVIDCGYTGEIKVILTNLGNKIVSIEKYDKIAQLVFSIIVKQNLIKTNNLGETLRGINGFGSTGK